MGKLAAFGNYIGISSCEKIYILDKIRADIFSVEIPPGRKNQKGNEKVIENRDDIVCLIASRDSKYLAAATQSKRLVLWNVPTFSFLKEEYLVKRPMAIAFAHDSSKIIVADKNGEIYNFDINTESTNVENIQDSNQEAGIDEEPGPKPILGHLSMLLDMQIANDGKFLVTCDRDEKIRISCYPNCYNIHTFCLGHTEFVSQIRILPGHTDRLLSASGDGTVRLWNHMTGECVNTLDVRLEINKWSEECLDHIGNKEDILQSTFIHKLDAFCLTDELNILAVSFYKLPVILIYTIENGDSFQFLTEIKTQRLPIDFTFLENGAILIYLECVGCDSENPFTLYEISKNLDCIEQVTEHPVLKFGHDYRDRLKGEFNCSVDTTSLYKHKYDNVADYKKKKEARLHSRVQTDTFPCKRKAND